MPIHQGIGQVSLVAVAVVATMPVVSYSAVARDAVSAQEKMVVVSSRTPKAISDIPGTVWYVDAETIEREYRGGKSLGQILAASIPALDVSTEARTNYGQNLRGRSMLVMIDGVSLQSSRSVSRYLDSIDPFNIDRIEVLSGATSVYGAGATGGVINIITKKADAESLQFESLIGGSSGFNNSDDFDYKLAQSVAGGSERVKARASVVYGETKGFFDADGEIVTPDISQGNNQYNEMLDTQLSLNADISDSRKLSVLAQYYDSQQDSPYGLYIENGKFIDVRKGFSSDREHGTERIMLNGHYSDEEFLGHQLLVQASYRKEDITFTPYYQSASEQKTEVYSLKAALAKNFGKLDMVYGVDGYVDKFDSNQMVFDKNTADASGNLINRSSARIGRYPGVTVSSVAAFIQADYKLTEKWSVQGGYRYQYINNEVDDFVAYSIQKKIAAGSGTSADAVPGGETDYAIGLFNLGTLYKLTSDSQIWTNFSQGFELADPAKYYGQGNYSPADSNGHYALNSSINVDDSKMDGIKTDSYEIGYRLDHNDFREDANKSLI